MGFKSDGVTVGTSSTTILAPNDRVREGSVVNDSDQDIYIRFGEAAVMNEGILLNAGGGAYNFKGEGKTGIYGICLSGGKNATYSVDVY